MIDSFTGEYHFLSNFHVSKIKVFGDTYPNVEAAYQAQKTLNPESRAKIRDAKSPRDAKRLGREVQIRDDWENIKLDVMLTCVKAKFKNLVMQELLLATGNVALVEGNTWRDFYWGVCDGEGENHLGKILMRVRDEIRSERTK